MSDPRNPDGYSCCHGLMLSVEITRIAVGLPSAFLCMECGKYRHAFRRGDERRALVNAAMPDLIAAQLMGSRGDVA